MWQKRNIDDIDADRPLKHARLGVPTTDTPTDLNAMEIDVKSVEQEQDESGFNGSNKSLCEYFVDRDDKLSLNMHPSAINWPLYYLEETKSQRLIRDWLFDGSRDVRLLFSKVSGLFL